MSEIILTSEQIEHKLVEYAYLKRPYRRVLAAFFFLVPTANSQAYTSRFILKVPELLSSS